MLMLYTYKEKITTMKRWKRRATGMLTWLIILAYRLEEGVFQVRRFEFELINGKVGNIQEKEE